MSQRRRLTEMAPDSAKIPASTIHLKTSTFRLTPRRRATFLLKVLKQRETLFKTKEVLVSKT
jgi:hypothetical protein